MDTPYYAKVSIFSQNNKKKNILLNSPKTNFKKVGKKLTSPFMNIHFAIAQSNRFCALIPHPTCRYTEQ